MRRKLKEGAVFIADAHYPRNKEGLLALFERLYLSPPPQCFLMGDMFEFLAESAPYSIEHNRELITAIDALSRKTELYYLEGNHDYLLKNIFAFANVICISDQPLIFEFGDDGKKIAFLHGDKYSGLPYKIYSKLIRNPFVIGFLRLLTMDKNGRFIKQIYKKLSSKNICKGFVGLEKIKEGSLEEYRKLGVLVVVEGHFHIRDSFDLKGIKFEALEAFACNKSFFKVEFRDKDIRFVKTSLGALKDGQAG